jgi:hypothetical protein
MLRDKANVGSVAFSRRGNPDIEEYAWILEGDGLPGARRAVQKAADMVQRLT